MVLTFAERPDERFVKIAATGPGGTNVVAGPPRVSGTSVTQPLIPGGPGLYTVVYRVVSADGHPVQGSMTFTSADRRPPAEPRDCNSRNRPPRHPAGPVRSATTPPRPSR